MISPQLISLTKKELKSYFSTPMGYVFLIIFLFAIGQMTFEPGKGSFFVLRQASLDSFFRYIPWLYLFFIPAVTMRLWAEERRTGTVELLLTLPIDLKEAIWAKFLASWIFVGISLLLTFPMVITVFYLGSPDPQAIFWGYIGSFLLAGSFLAIGIFFSAVTKSQVISFILTVVVSSIFLNAGSPPVLEFIGNILPRYFVDLFESLSLLNHFESLGNGLLRLGDLWFFAVVIFGWLYGCQHVLENNKVS